MSKKSATTDDDTFYIPNLNEMLMTYSFEKLLAFFAE